MADAIASPFIVLFLIVAGIIGMLFVYGLAAGLVIKLFGRSLPGDQQSKTNILLVIMLCMQATMLFLLFWQTALKTLGFSAG